MCPDNIKYMLDHRQSCPIPLVDSQIASVYINYHLTLTLIYRADGPFGAVQKLYHIFTDSALWAGSVIEWPCPYMCMSVIIVNNGQYQVFRQVSGFLSFFIN